MSSLLGYAIRALARDWSVSTVAITLLALTLGTTAGIYSVVQAVLLRPLPFADQDHTVVVWQRDVTSRSPVVEVALGESDQWRDDARQVLDDLAVFGSVNWTLSLGAADGPRERVPYAAVSSRFFAVAGANPLRGRVLMSDDDAGTMPRVAVVSERFWREHLETDPGVVGRRIRAQDVGMSPADAPPDLIEIVGVMPAAFDFPRGAQLWLPAAPLLRSAARGSPDPADEAWNLSRLRVFYGLGRVRTGTPQAAVSDVLSSAARRGDGMNPSVDVVVTPVLDYTTGPVRPVLWLMQGGAALMLLLACSSVAGLLVFRAARRDHALAVHLALGASRRVLLARTCLETALLTAAGGMAAAVVTWGITRVLVARAPVDVPRLDAAGVNLSVIGGLGALTLLAAVVTAIWPLWFVSRVQPGPTLTTGARTAMHPRERRWQRLVVGWQVTAAIVILTGAALFVRSVRALDQTALGFEPRGLTAVEIEPSTHDLDRADRFYDELLTRLRGLPTVRNAAAVYLRPFSGPIGMDGRPVLFGQEGLGPDAAWRNNPMANLEAITPGYFATLGTRLLAGRDVSDVDRAGRPDVVVVSASAAARYWPGQNPIGQRLVVPTQRGVSATPKLRWMTVVGVVDDVRYRGVTDPRLDLYLPATQSTMRVKHVLFRTDDGVEAPIAAVRALARALDPAAHVGEVVSMSAAVARETAPWRFAMRVLLGYGLLAILLAGASLMAMVSLAVTLRRRELGIRAALGATPARLRWDALRDAIAVMGVASVIGVLVAFGLGRLVPELLVGVSPQVPTAIVGALVVTAAISMAATWRPAATAARSDPATALRE